ncbi:MULTISPECIES: hypothetical protein [Sphingobium]|uniref:hypothetical protein n=1 Tax=Sphingobium TaxID=165695 RepID=UPI0015EBB1D3|nr:MULTISPECIES: hypothetical protein [Sphingobium]MCW2362634.1 hypothetical protein [Sphingobium sp. B10D3B]MCW2400686.1 hypothetical protein [Sphingobium sp. B10D7B]MCW2407665.1 hypothetical protein [Sphingobium xanthum]
MSAGGGRPLRFLGAVLGCWVCVRGVMLGWPVMAGGERGATDVAALPAAEAPSGGVRADDSDGQRSAGLSGDAPAVAGRPAGSAARPHHAVPSYRTPVALWAQAPQTDMPQPRSDAPRNAPASAATLSQGTVLGEPSIGTLREARKSGRLSGQAWLFWRPDAGGSRAFAPLLGGSQMGVRLDYRVSSNEMGVFSLYGRASRAIERPFAEEGAFGLAWRPAGLPAALPVSLMVERRQRLGTGGRNGFALLAAGGLNTTEIQPRVEADGYAQAGFVGLPGSDGFADGKAALSYRLFPPGRGLALAVGGALSGSVQPGARRLDIGPQLRARLPWARPGLSLSAEWRFRIAGNARPASGPAITLATDF